MTLSDFEKALQRAFPLESAMSGDNVGLQIRGTSETVRAALCCMEITDEVVAEAISSGADGIITFHPLIYSPLYRLDDSDRVTRLVARCLGANLFVYCVHTAFDAHPRGTNRILADRLGLVPVRPIEPNAAIASDDSLGVGMGLITSCDLEYTELLQRVATVCGGGLRHTPPTRQRVTSVAIAAGSGMSLYEKVVGKADVFITADVKYHSYHAAQGVIGLIDPGHYEMERYVAEGIASELSKHSLGCTLHVSSVCPNPVRYHHSAFESEPAFSVIS